MVGSDDLLEIFRQTLKINVVPVEKFTVPIYGIYHTFHCLRDLIAGNIVWETNGFRFLRRGTGSNLFLIRRLKSSATHICLSSSWDSILQYRRLMHWEVRNLSLILQALSLHPPSQGFAVLIFTLVSDSYPAGHINMLITYDVFSTQVALMFTLNSFHVIDASITRKVATSVNDKAVDGHNFVAARTLTHGIVISADIFGRFVEVQRNVILCVFTFRV